MSALNLPVLCLNKLWVPINVVSVKKAIKMVCKEAAMFVDPVSYQLYDWNQWSEFYPKGGESRIKAVGRDYLVPEVLTIKDYDKLPSSQIVFSRRNIFKRDRYVCQYCLDPKHNILTSDLRWVPLGDLSSGDSLVGFEEFATGTRRKYLNTTVVSKVFDVDYTYIVTLSDGQEFIVTKDHLWFGKTSWKAACKWIRTDKLLNCFVPKLFDVCSKEDTYSSGWLAGMYDGEGYIRGRVGLDIGVAQNQGIILDEIKKELLNRNFSFSETPITDTRSCVRVKLHGGGRENVRLLSTIRPKRLINKFNSALLGTVKSYDYKKVISIQPFKKTEIVKMQTSTGTFIADGFPHHNCGCQPDQDDLTIDHVVPRAQNGESTWTNCVLSCTACNFKKANRTPEQAHMKLLRQPVKPTWKPLYTKSTQVRESWSNFISEKYWDQELEP